MVVHRGPRKGGCMAQPEQIHRVSRHGKRGEILVISCMAVEK
jgi:hypothetical protein